MGLLLGFTLGLLRVQRVHPDQQYTPHSRRYMCIWNLQWAGMRRNASRIIDESASHFSSFSGPKRQIPSKPKVNPEWTQIVIKQTQSKHQVTSKVNLGFSLCLIQCYVGSVLTSFNQTIIQKACPMQLSHH